jgi:hypothetical protein
MSDHTTSKTIELFGNQRSFRALSGVVINASQRSDTYVSGSGSYSSVAGYGGGHTTVGSTVVVTSDIWIRGQSGQEYRLRFRRDIPAREGNVVHAIEVMDTDRMESYFDESIGKLSTRIAKNDKPISSDYVLLYNSTTGEWFYNSLNFAVVNRSPSIFFNYTGNEKDFKKLGEYFRNSGFILDLDSLATQLTAQTAPTIERRESPDRFCTQCGNNAPPIAMFCANCGTRLAAQASQ